MAAAVSPHPNRRARKITPLLRPPLTPLFDDLEQRTFRFFWDTANPQNGLMPDRYPTRRSRASPRSASR